jgi:hypothetical protein
MALVLGSLTALAGCGNTTKSVPLGGSNSEKKPMADGGGGGAPANKAPAVKLKPASELKTPTGLTGELGEYKVPKSGWPSYAQVKPGDFYENAVSGPTTGDATTRVEYFDVADHALITVTETKVKEGTTKIGVKLLFTEPDDPAHAAMEKEVKKFPDARKFKVGNKEIAADTRSERTTEGVTYKTWTNKQLPPGAALLTETSDGTYKSRLVNLGNGK